MVVGLEPGLCEKAEFYTADWRRVATLAAWDRVWGFLRVLTATATCRGLLARSVGASGKPFGRLDIPIYQRGDSPLRNKAF